MTARCGGGTSSQLAGTGATNVIGGGLITEGLQAIAPWLLPIAILVDAFIYEANTQCSSDPPPMPTFDATDAEILALGLLAPTATTTLNKIHNLLLNWAWDKFCKCDAGGFTPTPTVGPPANTTQPERSGAQACFVGAYTGLPPATPAGTFFNQWQDVTHLVLNTTSATLTVNEGGGPFTVYGIPAGTSSVTYTGTAPNSTGLGCLEATVLLSVHMYNTSGAIVQQNDLDSPTNAGDCGVSGSFSVPSTAAFWRCAALQNSGNQGTVIGQLTQNVQVWCGGGGPGVQLNCCPPDPSIALALQNILQLVQNLSGGGLKNYTKSTAHSALTGSGSLTVSKLAGMQVIITAQPPTKVEPGNPPYIFDMGWLSILTGDGMIEERRLTRAQQLWFPSLMPLAVTLGYYLNPGVTATITELLPA